MIPDTDIADIMNAAEDLFDDEDARQEYLALRLEGLEHEEARKLAARANESNGMAQYHQSRPPDGQANLRRSLLSLDWEMGETPEAFHSVRPGRSITMDYRTAEEREADWRKTEDVIRFLAICTPHQRAVVEMRFGLNGSNAIPPSEIAERLGCATQSVEKSLDRAKKKAPILDDPHEYGKALERVNRAARKEAS